MFALVGFLAVFFQVDGDEDELEVGEEGLIEPVVAGGGIPCRASGSCAERVYCAGQSAQLTARLMRSIRLPDLAYAAGHPS